MRNYFRSVTVLAVLYFLGIILLFFYTGSGNGISGRDQTAVKLNAIAKDAGTCWADLSQLSENDYGEDYLILSPENDILFSSGVKAGSVRSMSVEAAIKKQYPYAYVINDERVVGTVVIPDDGSAGLTGMRTRLLIGLFAFGAVLVCCALAYGVYIRKRIILPFRELKNFAGSIAEGKLDEPLQMDKDNIFGAFTESFDIMREELAASREREHALQKKERELVASLSHDLKTPITGIKLTTELLKAKIAMQGDGAEEGKADKDGAYILEKLDNIDKKTGQIDALVSDLFSSTLDDLGEFKVNCKDEESTVLSGILQKYDDRALVRAAAPPQALICIDARRIGQVIGNIIGNSYKYANTAIDVEYTIVDDYLQMKIADHGPGVPAEELPLITNRFYRGKQWEKGSEEGSGLGLYIAKTLMEKMDGELLAASDGDGLAITLLIPLS